MQGRPLTQTSDSSLLNGVLRKFGLLPEEVNYKFNRIMDNNLKRDGLLYLAVIVVGFTAIATTLSEKLICIGTASAILVARSFVKKYLDK